MIEARHLALDYPGLWQFSYFGKLPFYPYSRTKHKSIRAFLHPLGNDRDLAMRKGKPIGPPKLCYIPVGELARLRRGTLLENGIVISNPYERFDYETPVSVEINFDEFNISVIDRDKKFNNHLVIPNVDQHESLDNLNESNSLFLAIREGVNPYRYIIPCTEIFRFFYATSSVLANHAFSDKILNPDRYLWDTSLSTFNSQTGHALIWLRTHMLDADARFLARFAWDQYALHRLQEIYLYAAAAKGKDDYPRMVYAKPPIKGKHKTHMLGYESNNGIGSFFVTRLISCDVPPLFSDLKWDRDNDGRSNRDEELIDIEPQKPFGYNPPAKSNYPPNTLIDIPPNKGISSYKITEAEISERFPNLIKVPVKKLPQSLTLEYEGSRNISRLLKGAGFGSVIDAGSSKNIIGPTSIEAHLPNERGSSKATDVDPTGRPNDHISIIKHLLLAKDEGLVNVEFLIITDEVAELMNCPVNVMTEGFEDFRKPNGWIYLDDKQQLRRSVIIARVEKTPKIRNKNLDQEVRYIIEVQARKSGEFSTLVLWSNRGKEIDLSAFDGLIGDMVEYKQTKIFNEQIYGIEWNRLKHTTTYTGQTDDTKHFIERVFAKYSIQELSA